MADPSELHLQLRPALGSPDISRPGRSSKPDRVWNLPERFQVPVRWDASKSKENVPAASRICLGRRRSREVRAAGQRRNLQRAAEHALAGWFHYYERRAAADYC